MKISGPKTDPCGIPEKINSHEVCALPTLTHCFLKGIVELILLILYQNHRGQALL